MKKPSKAMQLRWVKILEEAKKELPRQGFVCWAIHSAWENNPKYARSTYNKLIVYISDSLGHHVDVGYWLVSRGISVVGLGRSSPKMQAYRLAWINQMQDMFSKGEG